MITQRECVATGSLRSVFIVGAGFSMYAGMPLQEDFTSALLGGRGEGEGPSAKVVRYVRGFVHRTFDHLTTAKPQFWPELEDIFTCLDLSANTGHNLGPTYRPSELRTVRRALIYRIMTMLRERYKEAEKRRDMKWKRLLDFMQKVDCSRSGFISTNWDTVVEDMLEKTQRITRIDYRCDAAEASRRTVQSGKVVRDERAAVVVKMHGSVNWLYCDNCRSLFWTPTAETYAVAGQLLSPEEWRNIAPEKPPEKEPWMCTGCGGSSKLGTRLATFSYLKALDFPMFQKSWFSAEEILREAKNWVFIGYSLPAADFEFKYLLKRVQLSRVERPNFVVISGGAAAKNTYEHYQRFFGRDIKQTTNFFSNGLDKKAVHYVMHLPG